MAETGSGEPGDVEPAWPATDGSEAQELEAFKARLAETAAKRAGPDLPDDRLDAVDDRFFSAYYDVVCTRVGQARSAAETVQRSAAAIGGLYGTALGVAFSVADNPLPTRAIIPLLFLGTAIITSTVYLAWQGGSSARKITTAHPQAKKDVFERHLALIFDFQSLAANFIYRRLSWLRAAIVALAIGLVLMPVPFIEIDSGDRPSRAEEVAIGERIRQLEPAWPNEPAVGDPVLRANLYSAQLAEIARERERRLDRVVLSPSNPALRLSWLPETGWAILTLLLLALVGAVAWRARGAAPAPPSVRPEGADPPKADEVGPDGR
jgi:hypothetical protein